MTFYHNSHTQSEIKNIVIDIHSIADVACKVENHFGAHVTLGIDTIE